MGKVSLARVLVLEGVSDELAIGAEINLTLTYP